MRCVYGTGMRISYRAASLAVGGKLALNTLLPAHLIERQFSTEFDPVPCFAWVQMGWVDRI
jgi:hypothetical protein